MARTNRVFNDGDVLRTLNRTHAINVEKADEIDVEVYYDGPTANTKGTALVTLTVSVRVTSEQADEMLKQSL